MNLDQIETKPTDDFLDGDEFVEGWFAIDSQQQIHLISVTNKPRAWASDTLKDVESDLGDLDQDPGVYWMRLKFKWDQPKWGQCASDVDLNLHFQILRTFDFPS